MEFRTIVISVVIFCVILFGLIYVGTDYMKSGGETGEKAETDISDPEWDEVPAISKVREAYENNAIAAGRAAVYCQHIYKATNGTYANSVDQLAEIDKSVLSDPDVIFIFDTATEEEFLFTTSHKKGSRTHVFK